ncbi:MAG: hypothetical protein M1818_002586 [Claussenomyces sp. TS43310]|nr:MAG: hypothetical protein M1818_002586 [Claussenomyces sp. TS43310]
MSAATSQYPQQLSERPDVTAEGQSSNAVHKRVYQACIPCRRRKVKCDLGSVDNPGDPPCVRCRRESKECYFSATRRKRKLPEGGDGSGDGYEFDDDYVVRNGRKRLHGDSESGSEPPAPLHRQVSTGAPPATGRSGSAYVEEVPLTPGGRIGRTQPLRRPRQSPEAPQRGNRGDDANIHFENPEARDVMRPQVYGPHDALNLLYKAATDSPGHRRTGSDGNTQHAPRNGQESPVITQRPPPQRRESQTYRAKQMGPPEVERDVRIDPALSAAGPNHRNRTQDTGYKDAVKAWSRFRFVRAGSSYYEYLSPLTPISPPTFRNPGTHPTLLTEEPVLTVTLLTIASRYRRMPGAGGHCRSHAIHEQLWTYLRGMIERCMWGQEAFGGGFCGSGAIDGDQSSSTAPWRGLRKGSLRTLGTVESLMILTEWHPRALHFPPADATDELMLPSYDNPDIYSTDEDGNHRSPGAVGGRRIESWLEPAWRSDRMCWMLLSNAMGLSYELGVFDDIDELLLADGDITRPEYEDESYRLRAGRIKKLLLIYLTQLAGRLGWTNMVPHFRTSDIMEHRKSRTSMDGNTPGTTTTMSNSFNYIPDLELDDQIIHCWIGITNAMRIGNERIFRSRKHTTNIIQSGRYIELLKEFQPMLKNWWQTFEGFRLPPYIKHILTIEYEYVRIYINSLALQAVVERCTNNAGNPGMSQNGSAGVSTMSPETQNYYGKLSLARLGGFGPADQEHVKEVVEGSRNLLRTVVDGLLPGDYLKHAPVRTYFRIISGAMFLLKTFALGASKNDVELSIGLMDRAVDALRTCVVDDVHLGTRFADLLETLTSRLRNRFMHAPTAPPPRASSTRVSPTPRRDPTHMRSNRHNNMDNHDSQQTWNIDTPGYQDHNALDATTGISATHYDAGPGATYMDPSYNNNNNNNHSSVGLAAPGAPEMDQTFNNADWIGGASDMWYLPPGAAFFQNSDQPITQTSEGVNVGGIDLLDYMAMDPFQSLDGIGF